MIGKDIVLRLTTGSTGLSGNASSFQKDSIKNGGQITSVQRNIDFDTRHRIPDTGLW